MANTLNELRRAGAVGAICLRYFNSRNKRNRWERCEEWAKSEFRDASPATIKALIKRCQAAVKLAQRINQSKETRCIEGKAEIQLRGR